MLIGDNLADFNDEFEVKLSEERTNYTDELSNDFGTKLIVLPNPNYGDWESNGIFNGKDYNDFQKDSIRKAKIKSY
jgi:predicted secreted acid phosphatase